MREPRPQRLRQRYSPPPPAPTYRALEQGRIRRQRGGGGAPMSLECEEPPPPHAGERPPRRPLQGRAPRVPRSLVSVPVESPQPFSFGRSPPPWGFSQSLPQPPSLLVSLLSLLSFLVFPFNLPSLYCLQLTPSLLPFQSRTPAHYQPTSFHALSSSVLVCPPWPSPLLSRLPQSLLSTHPHLLPPWTQPYSLTPPPLTHPHLFLLTDPSLDTPYSSVPVACHPRFHGL